MKTHCTFATLHDSGEGFGLFHLQTRGSLHSSDKNANSISKLNPASCPFYLGQLFLCPTTSPSTMPVVSYHLCKLPSTVSKSAFFSTAGIFHSKRKFSRCVQWVIFLLAKLNWSHTVPLSFLLIPPPLCYSPKCSPRTLILALYNTMWVGRKSTEVWCWFKCYCNSSAFQKTPY